MKKILQISSVFLLSCLAVVLFGVANHQKALAVDALTGQCHWKDSGHIYCGENVQAVDYYFNSAATKSYGKDQYAVFLDGTDSNPVLFVDMKGDGKSAFLTDKVESIPNGAQNGLIDNSNYNNVPGDNSCSIHSPTNCDEHLDEPFKSDSRFNAHWGGDLPFPADVQAKFFNQTLASAANGDQGCEKLINNPLSFFLCPLGNAIAQTLDKMTNFLLDQLHIVSLTKQDNTAGGGIQSGFNNFRTVANSVYVLIFLFIILGNFISIPSMDNYKIKKILPKLITCVIITQFAFLVCTLAIDLSNVLLDTVPSLVTSNTQCLSGKSVLECSSIGGAQQDIFYNMVNGNAANNDAVGAIQGTLGGIGFFILALILVALALIVILIALFYIAFRNVALIILVFISPLAIAAWVLPNTERFAKKWASWFVRLLLMGPIVGLILASSVLIAKVLAGSGNMFMQFLAPFVAIFAFILIPKSFKWSADLMNATGSMIANSRVGKAGKESYENGKAGELAGKGLQSFGSKVPGKFGEKVALKGANKQAAYKAKQRENYENLGLDDLIAFSNSSNKRISDNAKGQLAKKQAELSNQRILTAGQADQLNKILINQGQPGIFGANQEYDKDSGLILTRDSSGNVVSSDATITNPLWNGGGATGGGQTGPQTGAGTGPQPTPQGGGTGPQPAPQGGGGATPAPAAAPGGTGTSGTATPGTGAGPGQARSSAAQALRGARAGRAATGSGPAPLSNPNAAPPAPNPAGGPPGGGGAPPAPPTGPPPGFPGP